jgi:2,4-dienoyl-CoA reductase-like NADH-dependent reductase (Old Yellow Enzyme family)
VARALIFERATGETAMTATSLAPESTVRTIFRPWRLGPLEVPNRLLRSATEEGLSTDEGAPTPRLIDLTAELARGGTGLIVCGSAFISREGRGATNVTGIDRDGLIEPLRRLCAAVHEAGGLVAAQLLHSGSTLRPVMVGEKAGPYGPSPLAVDPVCGARVLALTKTQIGGIVSEYASAACRAREAGFDAVQIHAAHGYLINQFLSPARNRRTDAYGGALHGRARLLREAHEAVRRTVGPDYPVFVKMSIHDGFPGGVEPAEAALVAAELDAQGIDAIEVSAGTPEGAKRGGWDHIMPAPFVEGRFLDYALLIKAAVACPVICVEGWRDPQTIAQALQSIDAVSLCRPFIREPHLTARWRSGDLAPATCISCNKCLDLIVDEGLGCIFHGRSRAQAGRDT